jgi:hypothetical protein
MPYLIAALIALALSKMGAGPGAETQSPLEPVGPPQAGESDLPVPAPDPSPATPEDDDEPVEDEQERLRQQNQRMRRTIRSLRRRVTPKVATIPAVAVSTQAQE